MGKLFILSMILVLFVFQIQAFAYSGSSYGYRSYRSSSPRNYKNGGAMKLQKGYIKPSSGQYVGPHLKTSSDNSKWNNLKQ